MASPRDSYKCISNGRPLGRGWDCITIEDIFIQLRTIMVFAEQILGWERIKYNPAHHENRDYYRVSGGIYNQTNEAIWTAQTLMPSQGYKSTKELWERIVWHYQQLCYSLSYSPRITSGEISVNTILDTKFLNKLQIEYDWIESFLNSIDYAWDWLGYCQINCQVTCQYTCQLSCQNCYGGTCHNQHCGGMAS